MAKPKSYWMYRRCVEPNSDGQDWYSIRECYYEDDVPVSVVGSNCAPGGESREELRDDYETMAEAFGLPVIRIFPDRITEEDPDATE